MINLKPILEVVKEQYQLPLNGIHGIAHWVRVYENALYLAEPFTTLNLDIVGLFAVLHDACRVNENQDKNHGLRAAGLARKIWHRGLLPIKMEELYELQYACHYHTDAIFTDNIFSQVCWDADRLDLWRVGVRPIAEYLNTDKAKELVRKITSHRPALENIDYDALLDEWGV